MTRERVALYARFSTDKQNPASAEDQLRVCREYAARQGWTVVAEYADEGITGKAMIRRPGIQSLMRDAQAKKFDVVLAEGTDRLSRDLENSAGLYKRLEFAGIRIVTVTERDITPLQIAFKGAMNAAYIDNVRYQTRRGQRSCVKKGRAAGGLGYGYRVVPSVRKEDRGQREIVPEQAAIVRRIFREYDEGRAPKAIVKRLNAEGVRGPAGGAWSPNTIHGNPTRGTGILNNELYVGRLVYNRLRYIWNPDTEKRVSRLNPPSEWEVTHVPQLRIIDDALWQRVKARQQATRLRQRTGGIVAARPPKYLFSGLTKCGVCGGGFTASSRDELRCFNHTERGTCTNHRRIKRQEVEARALRAMRERFFEPGAFDEFCRGFAVEWERFRREHLTQRAASRRELAGVEREIRKIIDAIKAGVPGETVKDEMIALRDRKAALAIASADTPPPAPALHPGMADVFREKVETLAAGLEDDDRRDAARQALRGFLERIVIPSGDGLLQVVGNFGEMLTAAAGRGRADIAVVGNVGCGGGI